MRISKGSLSSKTVCFLSNMSNCQSDTDRESIYFATQQAVTDRKFALQSSLLVSAIGSRVPTVHTARIMRTDRIHDPTNCYSRKYALRPVSIRQRSRWWGKVLLNSGKICQQIVRSVQSVRIVNQFTIRHRS